MVRGAVFGPLLVTEYHVVLHRSLEHLKPAGNRTVPASDSNIFARQQAQAMFSASVKSDLFKRQENIQHGELL